MASKDSNKPADIDNEFLESMSAHVEAPWENLTPGETCLALIDDYVSELEHWHYTKPEDIESLQWFDVGMDGLFGPTVRCHAWPKARVWLQANMPAEFLQALEEHVHELAAESRKTFHEIEDLSAEDHDTSQKDVLVNYFMAMVVDPCLRFLHSASLVVQERLGVCEVSNGKKKNVESGGGWSGRRRNRS